MWDVFFDPPFSTNLSTKVWEAQVVGFDPPSYLTLSIKINCNLLKPRRLMAVGGGITLPPFARRHPQTPLPLASLGYSHEMTHTGIYF